MHRASGAVKTEESKSRTTSRSNPISDTSPDLWKTLRNWVDAVERGDLPLEHTAFALHVSQEFEGDIVRRFAQARTDDEAIEALRFAAERVWRNADGQPLDTGLPRAAREHVARVFNARFYTIIEIIRRFSLTFGAGDAVAELKQAATVAAIAPDVIDDVLRDVLGWVKTEITTRLQQGRPAAIAAGAFRTHLRAARQRLDNRLVLVSAAPSIDARAISHELRVVQTYIRQLELIDADDTQKLDAATDFLRASICRVEWADRGTIHPASFGEFEAELESTWRRKKVRSDHEHRAHEFPAASAIR